MKRNTRRKLRWVKIFTTEKFSLFQEKQQRNLYEVSWRISGDKFGRRRFSAPSKEAALTQAPQVARLVTLPPPETMQQVTVQEAFAEALASTRRRERAIKDWEKEQDKFMEWLADVHPDCTQWRMVIRRVIREYMNQFKDRAPNTIRLRMQPIIQTSFYMSREYSLPNVAERLGIGSKLVKTPPMVYLTDVVEFLDWIGKRHPRFEAGAALQGLVGLQLQEALRLTWDKVDLERGLVEISGEIKNPYRNRVIPICGMAVESLERAQAQRPMDEDGAVPVCEHVVVSPRGCSFVEGNSFRNYSNRLSQLFREWNRNVDWAPKDLRNCILTFAVMEGLHSEVWEQYVGHSPRSITARHYIPRLASVTRGERSALERQMSSFRMHVAGPLDQAIGRIRTEQELKILNIFEQPAHLEAANACVS